MQLLKRLPLIIFICLGSIGFSLTTVAQVETIEGHLSSQEKKKLAKADKIELGIPDLERQAEDLLQKGDAEKAGSVRLKIDAEWREANLICKELYQQKLEDFRKGFTSQLQEIATGQMLEDQAKESFERCQTLRDQAKKSKDSEEKIDILSEALEYEKSGIKRQMEALTYYYNWPVDYKIDYKTELQNEPVAVNEITDTNPDTDRTDVIVQNDFTIKSAVPDTNSLPPGLPETEGYDMRSLSKAWYSYIYGSEWQNDSASRSVADIVNYPSAGDSVFFADASAKKDIPGTSKSASKSFFAEKTTAPRDSIRQIAYQIPESGVRIVNEPVNRVPSKKPPVKNEPKIIGPATSTAPETKENNGIYRIQIAAGKAPMSQNLLRKIYSGNKEITVVNENGWNKYSIGDFSSWEEANNFRKSCGIPGAFIVKPGPVAGSTIATARPETETSSELTESSSAVEFRVQIAASRKTMSANEISRVYKGNRTVKSFSEDGWEKYYIAAVPSIEQAKEILAESGSHDAFIAAYRDGEKINLYSAMRAGVKRTSETLTITPSSIPDQGRVYFIQLAASRNNIDSKKLSRLISVQTEILEVQEEGWYKYRLGPYNTYSQARSEMRKIDAPGLFITGYNNGQRMSVKGDREETTSSSDVHIVSASVPSSGLLYYLQITATKNKPESETVAKLCPSCTSIEEFMEDGMFKYRIRAGSSLKEANNLKSQLHIQGSFLVPFYQGNRITLPQATQIEKQIQ